MILYKYVSLGAAKKIVQGKSIGFSLMEYFNDPFDQPDALPESPSPVDQTKAEIRSVLWKKSTVVLSLSRSYTNTVMWSHYGDEHRGAVIEIDAHKAGFMDPQTNLIPAQFGTVVYSRVKQSRYAPTDEDNIEIGTEHRFICTRYEELQHLFLTKDLPWSYEEEVRVVKNCTSPQGHETTYTNESGEWTIRMLDRRRQLHCYRLPQHAISRLILGLRATSCGPLEWADDIEVARVPSRLGATRAPTTA